MSPVLRENEVAAASFRSLYAPIKAELAEVENSLRHELRSDKPDIDEMIRHGCLLGGKRLRPALLLLAAKSVGSIQSGHFTLATVVEMIHTATLIHDDVLDEAQLRRHVNTCNARWDNEASVLLGDYLFTHSFYLASTLPTTYACRTIGLATNTVCEGELRQVANRGNFSITEAEYIDIIESKTAALCGCACQLGAHYAGADPSVVDALAGYGRNLGIAFQITDDLLDVVGEEESTGKTLGTDIDKQKPTLPLIHVLEQSSHKEREEFLQLVTGNGRPPSAQLGRWFERFDTITFVRSRARLYADRARELVEGLAPNPAVEVLQLLPEAVVSRSI